jgi:hypothetical protein
MTGKTVTVKAITLVPAADSAAEEWSLQKYDIKAQPIDAAGATIEHGTSYDFYVRFYPVLGAERKASLKIETDAGTFDVALSGRGAPDSSWPAGATVDPDLAFGMPDKDELVGTLVADAAGNRYVSANVDFSTNEGVLISKVGADGKLAWSKFWNGQHKDRARDPGQNAESGGSAGSLSMDSAGNLYAVASVSLSSANSAFNAGLTKISADGTQVWSKLFGYGNIDKASKSAEFYAVDASGPVVYAAGTCGDPTNAIGGEGLALFVALDPKDGSVKAKKGFDFTPTYNDRIYAVRGDGKGSAWRRRVYRQDHQCRQRPRNRMGQDCGPGQGRQHQLSGHRRSGQPLRRPGHSRLVHRAGLWQVWPRRRAAVDQAGRLRLGRQEQCPRGPLHRRQAVGRRAHLHRWL